MYDYFRGKLQSLCLSKATLEIGGIGYEFFIPISSASYLQQHLGEEITFYVSFIVREDSHRLFGFLHKNEREMFYKLSDISGIGPKTALSILGFLTLKELEIAIFSKDSKTLSRVPGIGKKTAERLILEMQDKLSEKKSLEASKDLPQGYKDAISALVNLGYKETAATQAVKIASSELEDEKNLSQLISLALKAARSVN